VNPADLRLERSQRWRVLRGNVPGCLPGTVVLLSTNGESLAVTLPWRGVAARLDLRAATGATSDGRDLILTTAAGEVVFVAADPLPDAPPAPPNDAILQPKAASLVGQVAHFAGKARNVDGADEFVLLVMAVVNGWVVGLTRSGRPAGIEESNIAWVRVLDQGPHTRPDRLVYSYVGKREACQRAYESELPTLQALGYEPVDQTFYQEPRDPVKFAIALLLAFFLVLVLIGIAILVALIILKPPGILTVTMRRSDSVPAAFQAAA
jgi:hypothetical protein